MRKRLFEIIETAADGDRASMVYDSVMMIAIIISLIPMAFKETNVVFTIIEYSTVTLFILDYILRLVTADIKAGKASIVSFIRYPFTFMAVVDLLSILPSISVLGKFFKLFRIFRLLKVMRVMRSFRVFRVLKAARYSKSIMIILEVLKNSKEALVAVGTLALVYILISALVVFNVEPETFDSFFDAVYWATISLTTVGYGDVFCVSTTGKIVTMLSSIFGIAIVALPAGIITAGYMEALTNQKKDSEDS